MSKNSANQPLGGGSNPTTTLTTGTTDITLKAPSTGTDWTFTLPPNAGTSGQVLTTDGTGTTAWTTVSGGGGGGISSVGLDAPGIPGLTITNSPITSFGTMHITATNGVTGTGLLVFSNNTAFSGLTTVDMITGNDASFTNYNTRFGAIESIIANVPTNRGGTGLTFVGTSGQVLTSNGTALFYNTPTVYVSSVGIIPPVGFSASAPVTGSGNITLSYSGVGIPVSAGGTGLTSAGTIGQVLTANGSGGLTYSSISAVTSIGITAPPLFNVSPPVTTSGNINITYAAGAALPVSSGGTGLTSVSTAGTILTSNGTGMFWAPPSFGSVTSVNVTTSGATFLQAVGGPIITGGTIDLQYSGAALPIANGGTGLTAVGTSGQVLTSDGSNLFFSTPSFSGVTSVNVTVPSFMTVSGVPITSSGTIAITASSTGTGNIVLDTSPTLTTTTITSTTNTVAALSVTNTSSSSNPVLASFMAPNSPTSTVSNIYFGHDVSNGNCGDLLFTYSTTTAAQRVQLKIHGGQSGFNIFGDDTIRIILGTAPPANVFQIQSGALSNGSNITTALGRNFLASYNSAILQFNYTTSGSTSNSYGIGFTNFQNLYTFSGSSFTSTLPIILNNGSFTTTISTAATANWNFTLPVTAGTSGQVLTSAAGGTMTWSTITGTGTVTSVAATVPSFLSVSGSPITAAGTLAITLSGTALPTANGGTGLTTVGSSGQFLQSNGTSLLWASIPGSAGGTVTSVGLTVPSIFSVSGSPITASGTLAITTAVAPTGTGAIVLAANPTITSASSATALTLSSTSTTSTTELGIYAPSLGSTNQSVGIRIGLTSSSEYGEIAYLNTSLATTDVLTTTLQGGVVTTGVFTTFFKIQTTETIPSNNIFQIEDTALSTATALVTSLGVNQTNYNQALLQFNYVGLNNTGNSYGIGLFSVPNILKISGTAVTTSLPFILNNGSFATTISTAATANYNLVFPTTSGTSGQVLTSAAGGTMTWSTVSGTVSSVGVSSTLFTITGSPITSSGTIGVNAAATTGSTTTLVLQRSPTLTSNTTAGALIAIGNPLAIDASNGFSTTNVIAKFLSSGLADSTITSIQLGKSTALCANMEYFNHSTTTLAKLNLYINATTNPVVQSIYGQYVQIDSPTATTLPDNGLLKVTASSLAVGQQLEIQLGKDATSNNRAVLRFNYKAANSATNSYGIGFFGAPNLYEFSGVQANFNLPLLVLNSTLTTGQTTSVKIGRTDTTGESAQLLYTDGATTGANTFTIQFTGGAASGPSIVLTNTLAGSLALNTQYTSSIFSTMGVGALAGFETGQARSSGNMAQLIYGHQGNNNASSTLTLQFFNQTGSSLTLPNTPSGDSVLNTGNFSVLNASLSTGADVITRTGVSRSTGNSAEIVFHYAGSNSTSNTVSIGTYGTRYFTIENNLAGTAQLFQDTLSVEYNAVSSSGGFVVLQVGAGRTNGNMSQLYFEYHGDNNPSNATHLGFYGGGGNGIILFNDTSRNVFYNTGIESDARGEEYYLPSNQSMATLTNTEVIWSLHASTGHNLLTLIDSGKKLQNNTGRTVIVTVSYYASINGSTGGSRGYIQKNDTSGFFFKYGATLVGTNDFMTGTASIILTAGDSFSIVLAGDAGVGLNISGGSSTDLAASKLTYVIHA